MRDRVRTAMMRVVAIVSVSVVVMAIYVHGNAWWSW